MSYPIQLYWPSSTGNTAVIASLQNTIGAGSLVINYNLPNSPVSYNTSYVYDKMVRTVSLTSANNLSGVNFTITGIGSPVDADGNPTGTFGTIVSEVVAGPNANTVYSTNIFSTINSITVDGAVNQVSAGFGDSGITDLVFMDYNRYAWYATSQCQLINRSTLTYSIYQTVTKPYTPDINFGNLDLFSPLPAFLVGVANSTANQLVSLTTPVVAVWANISNTTDDSLYFTVLQQGIR